MSRILKLCLSLFLFIAVPPLAAQDGSAGEDPPVYMGRAFLFQADIEQGLELGWLEPGYSEEELMAAVEESLNERLLRTGRFVEGVAQSEAGGRVTVTFVGMQAKPIEDMLIAGMSGAGRFTLHALPSDDDFGACGSSREDEAARFDTWMAGGSGRSVTSFNLQPRSEGGPCQGMTWLARREGDIESLGTALPVVRGTSLLMRRSQVERLELISPSEETLGVQLEFLESGLEGLREFGERVAGRDLAFAVDSKISWIWPTTPAFESPLVVQGRFELAELRDLVMAFGGEPLPVPLRFVEMTTRELPNVKIRDSPSAID